MALDAGGAAALPSTSRRMLHLAATGRARTAIDFALRLTAAGTPVDRLILDVLAPAQHEAGRLWQSNRWSVAQEYATTVVIDDVLAAVGLEAGTPDEQRGTVLVCCVEDERHTLPARMGVERLRSDGWDVTFLGSGCPADDLRHFTSNARPDVVVLSCTMPLLLPGAGRCIGALADLEVPAVVAGAAFGTDPARGDRVGASGWIGPGTDATRLLEGPLRPAEHPPETDAEARQLDLHAEVLLAGCLAEMLVRLPQLSGYSPRQMAHARDDVRDIMRATGLSLDFGEPALLDDFVAWLADVLGSRGVDGHVVDVTLDVLAGVTERFGFVRAADACAAARQRLAHPAP